jgi:3-(3-hydroxy-phenyl)propionate hydroxylase
MLSEFEGKTFEYRRSADQDHGSAALHPVVVVGAGPVGLTLAIDLAQQGIECVLLDDQLTLSNGSRAICFAKRTLEIFDRLGAGEKITAAGVDWHVGRVFFGEELLYQFDLKSDGQQHRPAFINLQQYVVEGLLVERAEQLDQLEMRFGHRLIGLSTDHQLAHLQIATPEGDYTLNARYVIACDGARSVCRNLLGLSTDGQVFKDRFLIADVRMRAPFPAERWFWFDPPFHRNQSALLHRQPEDLWRIDFQLGWDADPELEKQPERVRARVSAMLGPDVEFDLVWVSVYTFACQRLKKFVHGPVIFAGDAAHGVSPFGARGANGGVQDADNLAWKLAAVLRDEAPRQLVESYDEERSIATDENILNSTRSTDFITPKTPVSRLFRDATLMLAKRHAFARSLVNSGRLSRPARLIGSSLNTEDPHWIGGVAAGAPCEDAPLEIEQRSDWLLACCGNRFVLLLFGGEQALGNAAMLKEFAPLGLDILMIVADQKAAPAVVADPQARVTVAMDRQGRAMSLYAAAAGAAVLIRPDQHVAARMLAPSLSKLQSALARARGLPVKTLQ